MSDAALAIAGGGWHATLLPALGGVMLSLSHNGRDVLRPTQGEPAGPLDSACFPLVPYANRIAEGRFRHGDVTHKLALNFADQRHSLHGVGWLRPWSVVRRDRAEIVLEHRHPGDADWPWRYRAEQTVTLDEDGCTITIAATNADTVAVPLGLGLHPYFPLGTDTRLTAVSACTWLTDATLLPAMPAPADHFGDWATGAALAGATLIDNAYAGWDGIAEIADVACVIRVASTGARAFHLYRPPAAAFFCLEPVSHLPDALNREAFEIDVVAPGATVTLELRLSVR